MNRLFRAGALALTLLSGCGYFKNDSAPPGTAVADIAVVDAGKKDDASPAVPLDERLKKYFVEDHIEHEGMILGKASEELIVNDEKTEYVNSIFVEGTEQALRAVEQTQGNVISKIGDTYELLIPARSVEEREIIRSRLEQQAIEVSVNHILLFDNHLDTDAAERRGVNTWAYTHIQLPEMQHAIHIEERQLPAVAVIDSGFESDELNMVYGYDYADRDSDVYPSTSPVGGCLNADHGTKTSGIIAARNNGRLLNGVVPGAPLFAYKVQGAFSLHCLVGGASESAILAALEDVKTKNVVAVNMSVGVPNDSELKNKIRDVIRRGKLVVNAADNSGENIDYKASIDGLVVVGGTQITVVPAENGRNQIVEDRWGNSNYWTIGGSWLAAPGHNVALITGGLSSGTSFSAPFVTGLGALLMSYGLSAPDAFLTMRASADQINVAYPDNSRALWHRINAYRAVCSVADCDVRPEERDAGIPDAGVSHPDVGEHSDAEEAGRDAGAVERDIGLVVSDAAQDAGLPIPPDDLDAGIVRDDAQSPEPVPDHYELYILALPPPENYFQIFKLRTTPDCQFEPDDFVRMTDVQYSPRHIHHHQRGVLYFTEFDGVQLVSDDGVFSQILQRGFAEGGLGGGVYSITSSPIDDRVAFTMLNEAYVTEPNGEPTIVARVEAMSSISWRPDGQEVVVNEYHSDWNGNTTNSFTFLPLRGAPESTRYSPGKLMTDPVWQDNDSLLYFCAGDIVNNPNRADSLCLFHRNDLQEEVLQRIREQVVNDPSKIFNLSDGTLAFIAGQLYIIENGNIQELLHWPYTLSSKPFSPDGRLVAYYGRPEGVDVDGLYLYDRRTEQHCLLLGNATEAIWK